jgi:hypothetical protein
MTGCHHGSNYIRVKINQARQNSVKIPDSMRRYNELRVTAGCARAAAVNQTSLKIAI